MYNLLNYLLYILSNIVYFGSKSLKYIAKSKAKSIRGPITNQLFQKMARRSIDAIQDITVIATQYGCKNDIPIHPAAESTKPNVAMRASTVPNNLILSVLIPIGVSNHELVSSNGHTGDPSFAGGALVRNEECMSPCMRRNMGKRSFILYMKKY